MNWHNDELCGCDASVSRRFGIECKAVGSASLMRENGENAITPHQGGVTRKAISGAFLMCTCVFLLFQHVRYAHLVMGVGVKQLNSDPRMFKADVEVVPHLSQTQLYSAIDLHFEDFSSMSRKSTSKDNINLKEFHIEKIHDSELEDNDEAQTDDVGANGEDIGEEFESGWEATQNTTQITDLNSELSAEGESTELLNVEESEDLAHTEGPKVVASIKNNDVAGDVELKQESNVATEAAVNGTNLGKQDWKNVIPRAVPKMWKPPKKCATAEEMGAATVGDTRAASLRVRAMIRDFIAEHGAQGVGSLPGQEFCQRGFVLGHALEDGFGNNMYKVLTAAGVAVMLNRSLIIAERGGTNPTLVARPKRAPKRAFGDYLVFSNQTFTVREVRRLWAAHGCATKYNRPLIMQTDSLEKGFRHTRCICDDWTTLTAPIFEFKGASGAGAIQLLLKNAHPAMRSAAVKFLGNPALPDSRPNIFGELFRAFVAPNAAIQEAVQWALKAGPDPDITLHLRMLHKKPRHGLAAASSCIDRIRQHLTRRRRRPRVVIVTDTPSIIPTLRTALGKTLEVIRFNHMGYSKEIHSDSILNLNNALPDPTRIKDWGEMPRWVAIVDFFLAARARTAVVSGAVRRVSTTYAQLVAALAAAYTLDELDPRRPVCAYYSSLHPGLVASGLASQSGWGHSWRPFAGKLGCHRQPTQCACTALLPYAWWDAPWQSPVKIDVKALQGFAGVDALGQVSETSMDRFCAATRERPVVTTALQIPSYEEAVAVD